MTRRSISKRVPLGAAVGLLALLLGADHAHAAEHELTVTIAHAAKSGSEIHPELSEIAKDLRALYEQRGIGIKFESLRLEDKAVFKLAIGSSGRMQLPNGKWMTVKVTGLESGKDLLKLGIAVEKHDFKTSVGIAKGATAVLPGPDYKDGLLILVITRVSPAGG